MLKQIAIVGAGPGSLATAMRLASQGYAVQIFEAADRVGGRMRGFEDGPHAFDTGPNGTKLTKSAKVELLANSKFKPFSVDDGVLPLVAA